MKQLGLSQLMYAQDYDERFSPECQGLQTNTAVVPTQKWCWRFNMDPYIKNTQIFACPSSNNTGGPTNSSLWLITARTCSAQETRRDHGAVRDHAAHRETPGRSTLSRSLPRAPPSAAPRAAPTATSAITRTSRARVTTTVRTSHTATATRSGCNSPGWSAASRPRR